jgi:hypothetical protein
MKGAEMLKSRHLFLLAMILMTGSIASAAMIDFESALPAGVTLNNINDLGTSGGLNATSPRYIDFGGDVIFDSGDFWLALEDAETTLILTGYNDDYTAGAEVYILVYDINDTPTTYAGSTQAIDRLYFYSFNTSDFRLDNIAYTVIPAPSAILLVGIGTCVIGSIRKRGMA